MSRLALTLSIGVFEPATSFVSRLAALNGCTYVQDFCSDMGLNWKRLIKGDDSVLKDLAELSGADHKSILTYSTKFVSIRQYELHNQILTSGCYIRGRQLICPKCLEDDVNTTGPFGVKSRCHWQITQVRHCAKHEVELIELPKVDYPRDPHDFFARVRDANIKSQGLNHGKATALENYLSHRLESQPSRLWLDKIDFDVLASFCDGLGVLMVYGEHKRQEHLSIHELSEAANLAFLACSDGVDGIEKALMGVQRRSVGEKPGHYADFGPFSRWLARKQKCPRHSILIDIVRKYIWTHYPIGEGEVVLGKPCPERRLHNVSSAAEAYGILFGRMYRIQREFAAKAGLPPDQSNRFYFNVAEHSDFLTEIGNGLRRIEASKFLGCHPSSFDKIAAADLITPTLKLDQFTESYPIAELQRLIDRCMSRPKIGEYDPDDYMPILMAIRKTKLSLLEVIQLLRDGKIHYLSPQTDRANLGSILVNWRELMQLSGKGWPEGYTKLKLKKILRVNDSTIALLTREKYLVGRTVFCQRSGLKRAIFSQCTLDQFLREYVTLGILAHRIGTQAKHASAKLERLGVAPIQFPEGYSKIYRRKDIERTDLIQLDSPL